MWMKKRDYEKRLKLFFRIGKEYGFDQGYKRGLADARSSPSDQVTMSAEGLDKIRQHLIEECEAWARMTLDSQLRAIQLKKAEEEKEE